MQRPSLTCLSIALTLFAMLITLALAASRDLTVASARLPLLTIAVALGAFAGPAFEARVVTERRDGVVRFVLTRQGMELMAEHTAGAPN